MSITKTATGFALEPDIDYTDYMFEFPVIIHKEDKNKSKLRELGIEDDDEDDDDPDPLVGMIAFPHEFIVGYGDWMKAGRDKEEIREYGFDLTEVYVRGEMTTYLCTWKRETFKKKLNDHVKKLNSKKSESVHQQLKQYFGPQIANNVATVKSDDTDKKSIGWFGRLRIYLDRLFPRA